MNYYDNQVGARVENPLVGTPIQANQQYQSTFVAQAQAQQQSQQHFYSPNGSSLPYYYAHEPFVQYPDLAAQQSATYMYQAQQAQSYVYPSPSQQYSFVPTHPPHYHNPQQPTRQYHHQATNPIPHQHKSPLIAQIPPTAQPNNSQSYVNGSYGSTSNSSVNSPPGPSPLPNTKPTEPNNASLQPSQTNDLILGLSGLNLNSPNGKVSTSVSSDLINAKSSQSHQTTTKTSTSSHKTTPMAIISPNFTSKEHMQTQARANSLPYYTHNALFSQFNQFVPVPTIQMPLNTYLGIPIRVPMRAPFYTAPYSAPPWNAQLPMAQHFNYVNPFTLQLAQYSSQGLLQAQNVMSGASPPQQIVALRKKLWDIKVNIARKEKTAMKVPTSPIDYEMVTFKTVDPRELHQCIMQHSSPFDQIAEFISQIHLTEQGRANVDRFIATLNEALTSHRELRELVPVLYQFGSLSNGLGTYDSDLDLVVKFEADWIRSIDYLDYDTSILALEVIDKIVEQKLGLGDKRKRLDRKSDRIVFSRRCPIIQLNFKTCFPKCNDQVDKVQMNNAINTQNGENDCIPPSLSFNKCDISVSSLYGVHNSRLLKLFTRLEPRFYQLSMLLKYWIKRNQLIHTEAFSSYAFTMMIVFFAQNTKPPLFPSVQMLQQRCPTEQYRWIDRFFFGFCDEVDVIKNWIAKNNSTTEELILQFFRFYHNFDYATYAICPRLGSDLIRKERLYAEKNMAKLDFARSYICIEDPFVLEHNVGYIFRDQFRSRWRATLQNMLRHLETYPSNAVHLLTNPDCFDTRPLK